MYCLDPFLLLIVLFDFSTKIAAEAQHGLIAQVLKDVLFSSRPGQRGEHPSPVGDLVDTAMAVE